MAGEEALHNKIDQVLDATENGPRAQDRPVPPHGQTQAEKLPDPPPRLKPDTEKVEGEDAIDPPLAYYGGRRGDLQG